MDLTPVEVLAQLLSAVKMDDTVVAEQIRESSGLPSASSVIVFLGRKGSFKVEVASLPAGVIDVDDRPVLNVDWEPVELLVDEV